MDTLFFQPYTFETLKNMLPWIRKSPYLCNDISIGTFFMWHEGVDMAFCIWHDTFIARENIGDEPAFTYPFGADSSGAVDALIDMTKRENLPLKFYGLNERTVEEIRDNPRIRDVCTNYDRKWSDYIYDSEAVAMFAGKKYSHQRNHLNKFRRLYGEPQIVPVDGERLPLVRAMLDSYADEHAVRGLEENEELRHTRELLDHFAELDLLGACIVLGGKVIAFSIGEVIGDMLIIHVEKALSEYEGAYPTMFNAFVCWVRDECHMPLKIVNREDDAGDPGLRTSKEQYKPIGMVNKYLAKCFTPVCRLNGVPSIPRDGVVLTAIRESDKARYLALCSDIENNRLWGYDYREDDSITGPIDENTFYDMQAFDFSMGDTVNFALRETLDGELLGETIIYHFTMGGEAEIGCRLFKSAQGCGLGTRAFRATADFASDVLHVRPVARCFKENDASRAMILASGFRKVREDERFDYFSR